MTSTKHPVIMTQRDFDIIHPFITSNTDTHTDVSLLNEINRAIIVTEEAFPAHAIRLNSKVSVLDLETQKILEFKLVMPDEANSHKNLLSILTPLAIALIGFRKAEEVQYRLSARLKRYRILDVHNN